MACFITGTAEGDARLYEQEKAEAAAKTAKAKQLELTRMLCAMCRLAEIYAIPNLPVAVIEWWAVHKSQDEGGD